MTRRPSRGRDLARRDHSLTGRARRAVFLLLVAWPTGRDVERREDRPLRRRRRRRVVERRRVGLRLGGGKRRVKGEGGGDCTCSPALTTDELGLTKGTYEQAHKTPGEKEDEAAAVEAKVVDRAER